MHFINGFEYERAIFQTHFFLGKHSQRNKTLKTVKMNLTLDPLELIQCHGELTTKSNCSCTEKIAPQAIAQQLIHNLK